MKRKLKKDEELNFWQPASDMFSALLLIFMLVILLLGLYLVHIPPYSEPDPAAGDTYIGGDDSEGESEPVPTVFAWNLNGDGEGGGGSGGDGEEEGDSTAAPEATPTPSPTPTPTPTPTPDPPGGGGGGGGGIGGGGGEGEGEGHNPDEGLKSAVYVMMVDAETDRTIKEANVLFELYEEDGALQILNTYYPERITFRNYETTEAGTFFFPEKLKEGSYYLHELTEPEGYDAAENQHFVLDMIYDWPDPYVVRVPIYPSRNVIRVQLTDAETGAPVSGGSFDVIAAENIITSDGTLRYRAGQVVSEIVCDEEGYGVSEEVYLGLYRLRQQEIPRYYAGQAEDLEVEVNKKTSVLPPLYTMSCERTRIRVLLEDELYPGRGIADISFRVTGDRAAVTAADVSTGASGTFVLDELEKGVTYRIRQSGTSGNYRPNQTEHTVTVDARGYIDGEPEAAVTITNRLIRVSIGITDEFSGTQVPNVNLALYDEADTLLHTWTTTGSELVFTDLSEGAYYLVKDGDTENRYPIRVVDQAEIQTVSIHTTYVLRYVVLGASAVILIGGAAAALTAVRRKKKKKANEAANAETKS